MEGIYAFLNSKSGMQILNTSTNLNVVNKTGFYTVQNPVNAPIGTATGWSNLIVMNAGNNINFVTQILIQHTMSREAYIFVRTIQQGDFTDWYQFAPSH